MRISALFKQLKITQHGSKICKAFLGRTVQNENGRIVENDNQAPADKST